MTIGYKTLNLPSIPVNSTITSSGTAERLGGAWRSEKSNHLGNASGSKVGKLTISHVGSNLSWIYYLKG